VILFFSVMIVASLTMAFTYVPAKVARPPFAVRRGDACFAKNETVCDTYATSAFYFWNLTNAEAVAAGAEPPKLVEVGPYVMTEGKEKKSDIEFHPAEPEPQSRAANGTDGAIGAKKTRRPASVSYVATSYARWDPDQFGAGRALSDVIVGFNPAYATLVRAYGSELNFLYALTPRVVAGAVGGIASVFQALAANPATAAAMPHVAAAAADETGAALATLAEAQWADCSALGGASVVDLALPAEVLAAFPIAPELCAYVKQATNGSMVGFAAGEAAALRAFLVEHDPSGVAALGFLAADAADAAAALNQFAAAANLTAAVTATHALLAKGYVDAVARTYGKNAAAAAMGPLLGPASSGMFVARPAQEWLLGYVDPLTSSRYPAADPRRLVRAVTKTFLHDDLHAGVDRVPRAVADRAEWPGLGATPWTLATGADDSARALDVLESTGGAGATGSDDATRYAYTFRNETTYEPVSGKYAARAVYSDVKNRGAKNEPEVLAWFDFGSSLDFGRAVRLEHEGSSRFAHEEVELHTFRVARETLTPCPVSPQNCAFHSNAHGAFNVSAHRSIPTVVTMPHGFDADPRLWGFLDTRAPANSSANPFAPRAEQHQMEWDVFELSGDVLGMRLRYQNNFLVSPTDVFYPDLWTPPAEADAFDGDEGVYLPIAWADVSWRAPQSAIDDIAAIIKEAKSLTIVYMIGLPGASFLFVAYHAFALYVKRRVARGQREARDELNAQRLADEEDARGADVFSARDPRFQRGGPPPLGPSVVEKAKPFEDPYAVAERDHRDDASVVVVDVNGRR